MVRRIEEIRIPTITAIQITTAAEATKIVTAMVDDIEEVVVVMVDGKVMNHLSIREIVPDDMKDIAIRIGILSNDPMIFINVNFR